MLHVAPEQAYAARFADDPGIEYIAGDFEQRFGDLRIDVTRLQFPDSSLDAVICNHVLEHVPDDRCAMREIRRVLKPGGWAILLIPSILRETTFEDPTVTSRAERKRVFGQSDHVRIYGWDYLDRLRDAGFEVEIFRPEEEWPQKRIEQCRLRTPDGADPIFLCRRQA